MSAFRILSIRPVHDGWSRFMTAKVVLPDGHVADRQIEDHGTAVSVLPFDRERRVALLVRQPRTAAFFAEGVPDMVEAIAGRLESDKAPNEARREAQEEAGLNLGLLSTLSRLGPRRRSQPSGQAFILPLTPGPIAQRRAAG
jgi:8-oxo-dGTP pyrophosphatase MutT (NUDIX family)